MVINCSVGIRLIIELDGIEFILLEKPIKNLYIRIKSDGKVYVSVPKNISQEVLNKTLQRYVPWVKKKSIQLESASVNDEYTLETGETHYVWGNPYHLVLHNHQPQNSAQIIGDELHLLMKGDSGYGDRVKTLDGLYRSELNAIIPHRIAYWESVMGVKATEWRLKKMKTRWLLLV